MSEEDPKAAAELIILMHSLNSYPPVWIAQWAKLCAKWVANFPIDRIKAYIDEFLSEMFTLGRKYSVQERATMAEYIEFLQIKEGKS